MVYETVRIENFINLTCSIFLCFIMFWLCTKFFFIMHQNLCCEFFLTYSMLRGPICHISTTFQLKVAWAALSPKTYRACLTIVTLWQSHLALQIHISNDEMNYFYSKWKCRSWIVYCLHHNFGFAERNDAGTLFQLYRLVLNAGFQQ